VNGAGRMPRRVWRVAAAAALAAGFAVPAFAQGFSLESAVLDTRSARNLGVTTERGSLAEIFKAQKAVTFGILRAAGIDLDQLPPEVRARVERFQTTNVEAFRAFSQGLDLKDQGRFAEAKEAFRRAAEIDPNFRLAVEQQQAMPDVNLGTGVQMRAVVAAASNTAVERGKQGFVVDLSRAMAALQSGQAISVATEPAPTESAQSTSVPDYTVNPPGSGSQFLPNLVAGLAYGYATQAGTINIANVAEWTGDKYGTNGNVLESVGSPGDFQAKRLDATNVAGGSATLADGTVAYWGSWLSSPGASASVTVSGIPVQAPALGQVDYVFADATTAMPTSGTAVFRPLGGSLQQPSGTISVNFVTRDVGISNLGFTIGGLAFTGLNGSANYSAASASGAFQGNYTSGTCSGCAAFLPQSSAFGGNFVGKDAAGLVFSTILLTGSGTASGVHLFGR
jgi:hypothetical protein